MFQLTLEEWNSISSQFVMTSRMKRPKSAMPLAFTEHGVVMLSSILDIGRTPSQEDIGRKATQKNRIYTA